MVFVLNKNKKPLSPCHPARARKLLKQGCNTQKVSFYDKVKRVKKTDNQQEYRLKIDYGSRYTGLSVLSGSNILWLGELHHKTDIKSRLDKRRSHRRFRRNKIRYRKPRFLNKKKPKDWIPPSLQSRVDNRKSWVKKLCKLIPLTHISYENCKFDTQLMDNPEILGIEYQQGTLTGYNIREYLLEKFNRTCVYCGDQNIPLEIEHLNPKSRGGTNRIDNLAISCRRCNQDKGDQTAEEYGFPEIQSQAKKSLKGAAIINVTRWKVYETLQSTGLDVECGSGARTKMNRINLGLPKTHYYDSVCIGESTPEDLFFKTDNVLFIKSLGRGGNISEPISISMVFLEVICQDRNSFSVFKVEI